MELPKDAHRMTEMTLKHKDTGEILSRFYPLTTTDPELSADLAKNVIVPHIRAVTESKGLTNEETELDISSMKIAYISPASSC